jgi:hypothetical protein
MACCSEGERGGFGVLGVIWSGHGNRNGREADGVFGRNSANRMILSIRACYARLPVIATGVRLTEFWQAPGSWAEYDVMYANIRAGAGARFQTLKCDRPLPGTFHCRFSIDKDRVHAMVLAFKKAEG